MAVNRITESVACHVAENTFKPISSQRYSFSTPLSHTFLIPYKNIRTLKQEIGDHILLFYNCCFFRNTFLSFKTQEYLFSDYYVKETIDETEIGELPVIKSLFTCMSIVFTEFNVICFEEIKRE